MAKQRKHMRDENEMGRNKTGSANFMTGHDPMIGRGSLANMPEEKVMREYRKAPMLRGGMLDDTMTDIDEVAEQSEGRTVKYRSNQK